MSELAAYIRALVDIPSVTGSEHALTAFLERDLRERGFSVTLQDVDGGRRNVFATSPGVLPRVVLCTHLDTVPPFYPSAEDDEYVYGRGSCDAKGILAAMVFAARALRSRGIHGVGLLFVVGEEVDNAGAIAANELPSRARYIVVGEPTEGRLASGHKGSLELVLSAKGKAAHSAYPHLGESAIERLLDALAEIRACDWGRNDLFGPATVNVGTIEGGLAANVLAPEASAAILIRVVESAAEVQEKLDAILAHHPALTCRVIAKADATICHTRPGFEIAPVAFGTDIPALQAFGKPLLIGPGSIEDAHTSRERIGKKEALEAVSYYQRLARELLAEA